MTRRFREIGLAALAIICVAAIVLILAGCASRPASGAQGTASGVSGGQAAPGPAIADPAKREACFSNERVVETQASAWIAENAGTQPPASVQAMVAGGVLGSAPTCPSGGTYTYDPGAGRLTCSVHGHF